MAVIFIFSADEGSGEHSLLLVQLIEWLCRSLHLGIPSEETLLGIHVLLRKLAHMTEFGILYFLWRRGGLKIWQAAVVSLLYAASDEWHQSFVPNRCGCAADVIIDGAGALAAAVLEAVWPVSRNASDKDAE